jgi:hypothetical protein
MVRLIETCLKLETRKGKIKTIEYKIATNNFFVMIFLLLLSLLVNTRQTGAHTPILLPCIRQQARHLIPFKKLQSH